MTFQIGDKIAVLDDALRGVVTKVTANDIEIRDDSGMVFKFLASELVKVGIDQNELSKFSDINSELLKNKMKIDPKKKSHFLKSKNEILYEVDLHVNKLVNSTKGMDNYDMLNLQLDTAKRKLEFAIQKRISKVVFIHGVGEGVLKTELYSLLKNYPVKFEDASYQKYGLGATEVYILQNPI
jgi:dsDNA-specific endonuclease/ATPase MutS2